MSKHFCLCCGAEMPHRKNCRNMYCNNKCQQQHLIETKTKNWLNGDDPGWTGKTRQLKYFVRRYLHNTRGTACEVCGWDERHPVDGKVLTEIDHIDGDAENCSPDNLIILCPNCHSKTWSFRARNRKSKRTRS